MCVCVLVVFSWFSQVCGVARRRAPEAPARPPTTPPAKRPRTSAGSTDEPSGCAYIARRIDSCSWNCSSFSCRSDTCAERNQPRARAREREATPPATNDGRSTARVAKRDGTSRSVRSSTRARHANTTRWVVAAPPPCIVLSLGCGVHLSLFLSLSLSLSLSLISYLSLVRAFPLCESLSVALSLSLSISLSHTHTSVSLGRVCSRLVGERFVAVAIVLFLACGVYISLSIHLSLAGARSPTSSRKSFIRSVTATYDSRCSSSSFAWG